MQAAGLRHVEAEVRAEHEVDRAVAQAVFRHAHARAMAAELKAELAGLVEEAERVHIARGLHDAQMDGGQGAHRSNLSSAGHGDVR